MKTVNLIWNWNHKGLPTGCNPAMPQGELIADEHAPLFLDERIKISCQKIQSGGHRFALQIIHRSLGYGTFFHSREHVERGLNSVVRNLLV